MSCLNCTRCLSCQCAAARQGHGISHHHGPLCLKLPHAPHWSQAKTGMGGRRNHRKFHVYSTHQCARFNIYGYLRKFKCCPTFSPLTILQLLSNNRNTWPCTDRSDFASLCFLYKLPAFVLRWLGIKLNLQKAYSNGQSDMGSLKWSEMSLFAISFDVD